MSLSLWITVQCTSDTHYMLLVSKSLSDILAPYLVISSKVQSDHMVDL